MADLGTHCILELYDCPADLLDDRAYVEAALREAVSCGFATLLHEVSHQFHPQGVTALALVAESHMAVHTWPEYGYVAADVFTCGHRANAERACESLIRAFRARRHAMTKLMRGSEVVRDGWAAPATPMMTGLDTARPQRAATPTPAWSSPGRTDPTHARK